MGAPPSNQFRIEQLEQGLVDLRAAMAEQVSVAVNSAARTMQSSLIDHLTLSIEQSMQRLEARAARSKDEQDKFQAEIRSSLSALKASESVHTNGSNSHSGPGVGNGSGRADGSGFGTGRGGSGRPGDQFGGNWKVKKLDLPIFDGTNPDGWIFRAERYFHFYRLGDEEVLEAAVVSLDGDALLWYQWENGRRPIRNWAELKGMLLRQFRSSSTGSLQEQWLHHHQTADVLDYRRRFIELMAPLTGVPEDIALAQFLNGLKPELKAEVRVLGPLTLDHAMELAVKVEEKLKQNSAKRSPVSGFSPHYSTPSHSTGTKSHIANSSVVVSSVSSGSPTVSSASSPGTNMTGRASSAKPGGEFRRLSEKELQVKREKGECFRCDEKWSVGHRCKKRELNVILLQDDAEGEMTEDKQGTELLGTEGSTEGAPIVQSSISLNSVIGISNPKTLKLIGEIMGRKVVVMIDPGATHNFISTPTVQQLGLNAVKTEGFGVSLGNGDTVVGEGVCKSVVLELPSLTIVEDFLSLPLGNSDVILGVQWLEKLGTVSTNWKTQTLKFKLGEQSVTLKGDPALGRSLISLKSMLKTIKREDQGFLVEFNSLVGTASPPDQGEPVVPPFLQQTLEQYKAVFELPAGLPPSRGHEHAIILKEGTDPVSVRPYRYSQAQKDEIESLIHDMLKAGIIQVSNSPFSSPVILVKKNGSWRFCVDYRALNKVTVADKFPIPVIDELLDELHGACIFSKLDLKSGYHQIRVRAEDVPKTAFRTHEGHYEFLVMPFGLMNAPATFQALMNTVFKPFLRRFVLVFFDDILIYSTSPVEHQQHLSQVLQTLQDHGLYANWSKCEFGQTQLAYLGHIVSGKGVAVDDSKIQAMLSWPQPQNLKDLRSFLGLTGYYRRFIARYASIAQPLTDQMKKDQFGWSEQATTAFLALKTALASAPILAMPDFTKGFIIETDASGFGLGAILQQEGHPIAYFSKVLGQRARLKSIYEKELMAIVLAVLKWRHYLLGRRFLVRTDQQSLKFLMEQREVGPEYQKWVSKLMGYDFEIQYRTGVSNRVADALSRQGPAVGELGACLTVAGPPWENIKGVIEGDPLIQKLRKDIEDSRVVPTGYSLDQGVIKYKGRVVIPHTSSLVTQLLQVYHDSPLGGHSGELKTYQRLASCWFWSGMRKMVATYIRNCPVCQQAKAQTLKPAGLLNPLPIPATVWDEISMDFVEGLPKSNSVDSILVVVDRLTKYAHFIPLKHPFTAPGIATVFVREVARLHGFPTTIVSDRDKIFLSLFWKELFKLQGTKLLHSTAYHPQTDGQTEVVNKCIETYLRCFINGKAKTWASWLSWAEFWYNTSYHASTGYTPFKALYGRDPPPLVKFIPGSTSVSSLEDQLQERDAILDDLKLQLIKAQQRMKLQEDTSRRDLEFQVGDYVYLKLQPYRQQTVARRTCAKLAARYYGPFKVEKRIGKVAYKLMLPASSQIHPVFHVSQLRKAEGSIPAQPTVPNNVNGKLEWEGYPEKVLGVRQSQNSAVGGGEVLIKWEGLSETEATWEEFDYLNQMFPTFHLEDKVSVWAAGNAMNAVAPPAHITYQRRPKEKRAMKVAQTDM